MTITNLTLTNASVVFSSAASYTSMELYYTVTALFAVFITASWFLSGDTKPFEKLVAAVMALIFSVTMAYESFSLAIISPQVAGYIAINNTTQNSIIPVMMMQNSSTLSGISYVMVILCFVNVVNCILVLLDYSRTTGVKNRAF